VTREGLAAIHPARKVLDGFISSLAEQSVEPPA
jgi:hypothetical protein